MDSYDKILREEKLATIANKEDEILDEMATEYIKDRVCFLTQEYQQEATQEARQEIVEAVPTMETEKEWGNGYITGYAQAMIDILK